MKRLNILQLFARYLNYGGEEGSVSRIASALRIDHNVEYYTASSEDLLKGGLFSQLMLPFVAIHNPMVARKLRLAQQKGRFDCWQIHNVFPAISPSAYSTAFKLGVPVIHYLHNYKFACPTGFMFANGHEYRDGLKGNFFPSIRDGIWHESCLKTAVMTASIIHARKMNVFEKVARWIAISHAQKKICVEMGMPEENIDVIHHFIDTPIGDTKPIPENGHALFIGRLSPEKGVDRLIDAWNHLGSNRRLIIAGDGPEYSALRQKIDLFNLKNIELLGFVPKEKHEGLWQNAAFSIVPSVWEEPFGMVVLESWSHARPVVAHTIGALEEIVRDKVTGFLANPRDHLDLAAKIECAFTTSQSDLAEMGLNGYRELTEYYNKSRWLSEINAVYRKAGLLNLN